MGLLNNGREKMNETELKAALESLAELINQLLPVGDEKMTHSPEQWLELNDLTASVADATKPMADYWREVAD